MSEYIYAFHEGDGKNKTLLGGKGANLCEMTQIGLNVPPGFVISTDACLAYLDKGELPDGLMDTARQYIAELEKTTGKGFGDPDNPLLVSVRSGSAVSMPGMMDTILNLGLNQQTLQGLIKQTDNRRFGYDAYRRFIQLFGKVALNVPDEKFDAHFDAIKDRVGAAADVALSDEDLAQASSLFLNVIRETTGRPFPEDVYEQLEISIKAVFDSWGGRRAVDYRREFNITPDIANGTAVNIVAMVFGNMGNDSGTGVGFTRNPSTGANEMFGEYLVNAQGEDVVAGIRTPKAVQEMAEEMPDLYAQLEALSSKLETHYREVQDYEYTIEKNTLYCLQTRNGKMNAAAMVRTSVEMAQSGLISKVEALLRIQPEVLEQLLHPRLDPNAVVQAIAQGLPASPGAASGYCVFDADRAQAQGDAGEKIILVREETKPEDIHGFFAAQGILTSRGGKTSHAAVVARSMGKACVAGAEGIVIDNKSRTAEIGDVILREGDYITIDGGTGNVYLGAVPTVEPEFSPELHTLLQWADEHAELKVRANADTPDAAVRAVEYGAGGIGLCRTERMFNAVERLPTMVEMILADTHEDREAALNRLLPMQREDFKGIFKAMSPRPVTIRLLDPPIHEFLPTDRELEEEIDRLRQLKENINAVSVLFNPMTMQLIRPDSTSRPMASPPFDTDGAQLIEEALETKERMLHKVRELFEVNPMLGHRGVRLAVSYPEIYRMQVQAVLEAAAECMAEGIEVHPEVMVPQVCTLKELEYVKKHVDEVKQEVEAAKGVTIDFKYGTMIEVVRACMRAGHLAEVAEFFSFGTNDLTQAAMSFSREDAENKFLPEYNTRGILQDNPFEVIDVKGVGQLMGLTVQWGRMSQPNLKIGICGEHGGNPESIRFCQHIGLDYVSCSGPRVPIARLAAAHAKLLEQQYHLDEMLHA